MQYCSDELITETVAKKRYREKIRNYIKIVFVHINFNKTHRGVEREREGEASSIKIITTAQ